MGWSILPALNIGWDGGVFIFLFKLSVLLFLFGNDDIELNWELKLVFVFVLGEYMLFKDGVFDDGLDVFIVFEWSKFCWDIREVVAIELKRLDEIEVVVEVDESVPAFEEFGGGNDGIISSEGLDVVENEFIDCVCEWALLPAYEFVEFNELRGFGDIGVIPPFVMKKSDWTDDDDNFLSLFVEF